MIARILQIGVVSAGALVLSVGMVWAQAKAADDAAPAATGEASQKEMSPQQMLEQARATVDKMEAGADAVGQMLRQAREAKDVVKALCLDDVLSQMNVATRSAADRAQSLEAAVAAGSAERAKHESEVLGALASRGGELSAEANQCIGEETGVMAGSTLKVTEDASIPRVDASNAPVVVISSAPPVASSPTL